MLALSSAGTVYATRSPVGDHAGRAAAGGVPGRQVRVTAAANHAANINRQASAAPTGLHRYPRARRWVAGPDVQALARLVPSRGTHQRSTGVLMTETMEPTK